MNILVIGNGFDLAHGLPTKYGDFLEFVRVIRQVTKNGESLKEVEWERIHPKIKEQIINREMDGKPNSFFGSKQCKELLNNNIWIDYFLQCDMYQKENWIDFECEISNVIQSIDRDMHEGLSREFKPEDEAQRISNIFLNVRYYDSQITYRELRDILLDDLNRMTRALELYLCAFISKIENRAILPDIKKIHCDKILSFNYTDTYTKIYDPKELADYDYIHGKAERKHSSDTNNMVLGINEYLSKKRKNREVEFIAFKKFYQRIYKGTGCKYKKWVDAIRSDTPIRNSKSDYVDEGGSKEHLSESSKYHNLYIFGHSLDITDKDILRDLILNENVHTTIFYFNKDDFGAKIANLVKVIGQDELIKRTGGNTIEFKQQQDIVEEIQE